MYPHEKEWDLPFEHNWINPSSRDALYQVWLKLANCFSRRFLNFVNVFLLFCYNFPLKKGVTFHLNKYEFPVSKDALCQVQLKLAQWFWKRFLNFFSALSLFCYHLPLEKDVALHLNKLESPLYKDVLCQV